MDDALHHRRGVGGGHKTEDGKGRTTTTNGGASSSASAVGAGADSKSRGSSRRGAGAHHPPPRRLPVSLRRAWLTASRRIGVQKLCVIIIASVSALLIVARVIRGRGDPGAAAGGGRLGNGGGASSPSTSAFKLSPELEKKAAENDKRILQKEYKPGVDVGYVKLPTFPPNEGQEGGLDNRYHEDDGLLHIIFSSGCNYFQHWQSELLLSTAHSVGQRGRITRIVSGCHDRAAENVKHAAQTFPGGKNDLLVPIDELIKSSNPNFGLYVTPSFDGAKDFPWINKPSSIDYFLRHGGREELEKEGETIVAILDPDFIFIRPLTQVPLPPSEMISTRRGRRAVHGDNVARRGRPVAQRYGLGGYWVEKYPVADIVDDPDSNALGYDASGAAEYFSGGPPYILHVDDLTNLAVLWSNYMRPVLKVDTNIMADMWAYCIAAAHLGLEHVILDHYMISSPGGRGEAYPWLDEWAGLGSEGTGHQGAPGQMSCQNPPKRPPSTKLHSPTFVHLAQNFKVTHVRGEEWMFHKGHVPANIMECSSPLIREPPDDLYESIKPLEDGKQNYAAKQSAWILCHAVSRLNDSLMKYKEKFCPKDEGEGKLERRRLVRLIQQKTKDVGCDELRDKWCYPLAQIEGLGDDWRRGTADGRPTRE